MTSFRTSPVWFAVACLAGAEIGQFFGAPLDARTTMPALWPPTGMLVGALILGGAPALRILPFVSLAVMFVSMAIHGRSMALGAVYCAMATVDACLVAWVVRRSIKGSFTMHRVGDILVLIVAAALVPVASGAIASTLLSLSRDVT